MNLNNILVNLLIVSLQNDPGNCDEEQFDQGFKTLDGNYDFKQEYSSKLHKVFYEYLKTNIVKNKECSHRSGITSDLMETDFEEAFQRANQQITQFVTKDKKYLESDSRGLNFSSYLYQAGLNAKYNEFATKYMVINKCLNKYEAEMELPSVQMPENIWKNNKFCDLESDVSPGLKCDSNYKYRREDGKCNNLFNTNWGSSFHCQRRLLPPDYADGVSQARVASDGSALPNARLITTNLMPDIIELDSKRSSMHMIWGQFMAHDILKTPQYWGFAMDCCPTNKSEVHEECLLIDNIPRDALTEAFNQSCINFVRSVACNTCSLGHREQLNAATPLLDLSQLYGGNENNSISLRYFKRGELRGEKSLSGTDIPVKAVLPYDQDTLDGNTCNPGADRPWLTCFLNGDGIRGNQQPMVMSLTAVLRLRHNQHAKALSKINPHWNDEILYQEARRILIAEYNKINFCEYFPKILSKDVLEYYQLVSKENGFTKYNRNIDPRVVQAVGVAALRFGHSQVTSRFQVIKKPKFDSYGIQLRSKFGEISDIWDGNINGVIGGLLGVPARAVDPFIVSDVHDYLLFDPKVPAINDLPALSINRGRDHGVPAYVYYVEYCTGVQIKSWTDLNKLIPEDYVKRLTIIYKNVKDIDLFVGGIAERHLNGSIVGPTFNCLIAIQMHHWKYGDRHHFEHGGEAGSFTTEQLSNIRKTASLANLLCKTTDFDSIQSEPMFMPSKNNQKIVCKDVPEFDYKLWREESTCSHYCELLRSNDKKK